MDHPIPVTFIRLIVLLPLIGATINFLAGAWLQKTFGKGAISLVGCGPIADSGGPAVEVSAEGRKNTSDAERFEGKVQQRKVSRLSWNVNAAF